MTIETDIIGFIGDESGARCFDHAITDWFGGDEQWREDIDKETPRALEFRTLSCERYEVIHEFSFSWASSEDFYPDGVYCAHTHADGTLCNIEIVSPLKEREEEGE